MSDEKRPGEETPAKEQPNAGRDEGSYITGNEGGSTGGSTQGAGDGQQSDTKADDAGGDKGGSDEEAAQAGVPKPVVDTSRG